MVQTGMTRVRRIGAFLAIVWGVAASFATIDVLMVGSFDALSDNLEGLDSLAVSSAVHNSTVCQVSAGQQSQRGSPASPQVRTTAWALGVQVGSYTRLALWLAEAPRDPGDAPTGDRLAFVRQMADRSDSEITRLATQLHVVRPDDFRVTNAANGIREFVTFVEDDAHRTARAIAGSYSRETCELYKLGVYWGNSQLLRASLPGERNIYAAEIAYYAKRIGLPEATWRPMIARTPTGATGAQLAAEAEMMTNRVASDLGTPR